MADATNPSGSPTHRALAAIVFTDVADFSARMGADEERTMLLVKRDLEIISGLCAKHGGKVLKSTGDGALMYFVSAVQAVACAMEVQQTLAERAKALPEADALKHRIGIHLGDVFLSDSDVMGDGVNIAARLQGEAEPGGICISETVYDVVKNRLALKATYLGPRELKNIKEAVPVYQIILDAAAQGRARAVARRPAGARSKVRLWVGAGAAVAAASVAVVAGYHALFAPKPREQSPAAGAPPQTQAAAQSQPSAEAGPAADPMLPKIMAAKQGYLSRYDFKGMMDWLERNGLKDHPLYDRYAKLKDLKIRVAGLLTVTGEAERLVVDVPSPLGNQSYEVWSAPDGTLVVKDAQGSRTSTLDELNPPLMQGVIAAVLRKNIAASKNPRLREAERILTEELQSIRH